MDPEYADVCVSVKIGNPRLIQYLEEKFLSAGFDVHLHPGANGVNLFLLTCSTDTLATLYESTPVAVTTPHFPDSLSYLTDASQIVLLSSGDRQELIQKYLFDSLRITADDVSIEPSSRHGLVADYFKKYDFDVIPLHYAPEQIQINYSTFFSWWNRCHQMAIRNYYGLEASLFSRKAAFQIGSLLLLLMLAAATRAIEFPATTFTLLVCCYTGDSLLISLCTKSRASWRRSIGLVNHTMTVVNFVLTFPLVVVMNLIRSKYFGDSDQMYLRLPWFVIAMALKDALSKLVEYISVLSEGRNWTQQQLDTRSFRIFFTTAAVIDNIISYRGTLKPGFHQFYLKIFFCMYAYVVVSPFIRQFLNLGKTAIHVDNFPRHILSQINSHDCSHILEFNDATRRIVSIVTMIMVSVTGSVTVPLCSCYILGAAILIHPILLPSSLRRMPRITRRPSALAEIMVFLLAAAALWRRLA